MFTQGSTEVRTWEINIYIYIYVCVWHVSSKDPKVEARGMKHLCSINEANTPNCLKDASGKGLVVQSEWLGQGGWQVDRCRESSSRKARPARHEKGSGPRQKPSGRRVP